jgi:hypothetical protein
MSAPSPFPSAGFAMGWAALSGVEENSKRISAKLDEAAREGVDGHVKLLTYVTAFGVLALGCTAAWAQDAPPPLAPLPEISKEKPLPASSLAPPEVVASAVSAVAALGNEIVLGRYQVALERMNPQWKERTAHTIPGGMAELEKQLGGVAKQLVQQGISIISYQPQGPPQSYEVGPGKKVEKIKGVEVESLAFSKWLVLVPTVTKIRMIRQGQTRPTVIESIGYQVAISDKGKNAWTFIDGAGLSVNDLRTVFVNLPREMQLPPLEKHEAR